MESPHTDHDRRQRAEAIYGAFLEAEEPSRFETLLTEHPKLAAELRSIREDMSALDQVRRGALALDGLRTPTVTALMERLGTGGSLAKRFDLGDLIGRGGQGTVTEAREPGLGRVVAIKRPGSNGVDGNAESHEARVSRFLAEAQITAQLDHPGVVAVHELGVDADGQPYFSMARVRGRSFDEYARDETLVRAVSVLLRVAETTAFAHSRGVIHRDLKPANVMVGSFGEVYVMDWGLARSVGGDDVATVRQPSGESAATDPLLTDPSSRLGTLAYLAPEMLAMRAPRPSETLDTYAVGAMLYGRLAGHPPLGDFWNELDPKALLERAATAGPTPLDLAAAGAPAELVAIAQKAMARTPRDRYASMDELASDLRAYLEGRVVHAHGTGRWQSLKKWVARRRALAALIALTVVGSIAIAVMESRARANLDRSADLYRLPYLEEEALSLWPEAPDQLPALDRWLASAERLASRAHLHRGALAALRDRAANAPLDPLERLRIGTLEKTVARLDAFMSSDGGLLADVRARREWAASVAAKTLGAYADEWTAAAASIADPAGPYGFTIEPRRGLVPLGPDPASGLQEFALLRSGAAPTRTEAGALPVDGQSALVFVLIPAGSAWMGAQADEPDGRGYDALARPEESPVHSVRLDPYWISKYEMTAGQWSRLGGGQPSLVDEPEGADPNRHPVEGVSLSECHTLLARFELALPTEAQWEHAARAGTGGSLLGFTDARDLAGYGNLADKTVQEAGLKWPQANGMEWLNDGYIRHAPVGSFLPNLFGLYDVMGNVWEWCADPPTPYSVSPAEGTGYRSEEDGSGALARGGGFINNAAFARVTIRDMGRSPDFDSSYHGLRPIIDD